MKVLSPWTEEAKQKAGQWSMWLGKVKGYLTIIAIDSTISRPSVTVSCRCGTVRDYYLHDVINDRRLSCGCLKTGRKERDRAKRYQEEQQQLSDGYRMMVRIAFRSRKLNEESGT